MKPISKFLFKTMTIIGLLHELMETENEYHMKILIH